MQILAGIGESYAGGGSETHVIECRLKDRDGTWLQFEVQYTDLLQDEHVRGIVLNGRDVSERKKFEDQLAHQAFHDPVTGLANRALFADRVQHSMLRSWQGGPEVGVMFIDLDDFKTVNDSLGHAAGDSVLCEVGRRLQSSVRPADTVARFGGDEFAVLLDGVDGSTEAAVVAASVLTTLQTSVDVDGRKVYPRASVGICLAGGRRRLVGCRGAPPQRGRRHVHGEARQQGQLPALRAGDAQARRRASRAPGGAAAGARAEPARDPLPAGGAARRAVGLRRRGAAALAAPDERHDPAAQLHPARGGDRPDRADRPLGAAGGLPRGGRPPAAVPADPAAQREREPLRQAAAVGHDRRRRPRSARAERPRTLVARPRDHRDGDDGGHRAGGRPAPRT